VTEEKQGESGGKERGTAKTRADSDELKERNRTYEFACKKSANTEGDSIVGEKFGKDYVPLRGRCVIGADARGRAVVKNVRDFEKNGEEKIIHKRKWGGEMAGPHGRWPD